MSTYMIFALMLLQNALRCTFLLCVRRIYLGGDGVGEVAHFVGLRHHFIQFVVSRYEVVHYASQVILETADALDCHIGLVEGLFAVLFLPSTNCT